MYLSDPQKLAEIRALSVTMDKLSRTHRRFSPSAPLIIPATMIFVAIFAFIALIIKLLMNYLNSKGEKSKKYGMSQASSPDIPTTPEDQTSMATTASMKTRGPFRNSSRRRSKPPAVSLYQIKQKQSPGSSASKSRTHKAAMRAISRAAKAEANRSLSRDSTKQIDDNSDDNANNDADNSPTNLSQHSDDTDEIQATANQSGLVYAASKAGPTDDGVTESTTTQEYNHHVGSNQPEVHIVQIRDIEDPELQHSHPTWPQTESEI